MAINLLCISNGHGEDVIACRILDALVDAKVQISALPITGNGSAYESAGIPIIGRTQVLPSGGFLNRDAKQLAKDVQGGLVSLTRSQLAAIKAWAAENDNAAILAVGDIVPQIFSHLSGLPYVFVGTAKSEYWLRSEEGKHPAKTLWNRVEGWSGSVYLPWERWLMAQNRCRAVFVRDQLTATTLQNKGLRAYYAGNPMMDGLEPAGKLDGMLEHLLAEEASAENKLAETKALIVALISGSRVPEGYESWARIMSAVPGVAETFSDRKIVLLGAVSPNLSPDQLPAEPGMWEHQSRPYSTFTYKNVTLLLISDAFNDCLDRAEIAIATAGTATEQFVGLGKPAITLPGEGPQFTEAFATVQAKMLGSAVQMVNDPQEVGGVMKQILSDSARLEKIKQAGKKRMGEAGGAKAIAKGLIKALTQPAK